MNALPVITGGLLGVLLGSAGGNAALGLFCGLALGALFARTLTLQRRLDELEARFKRSKAARPKPPADRRDIEAANETAFEPGVREAFGPLAEPSPTGEAGTERPAETLPPVPPRDSAPLEQLFARAKNWLTTGNVPVKVGVSNQQKVEILDGLEPGQTVVTGPFRILRELKDGAQVEEADKGRRDRHGDSGD